MNLFTDLKNQDYSAGNIGYKFSIDIPSNSETIISYAVNESPKEALARIEKDQIDIFQSIREKRILLIHF